MNPQNNMETKEEIKKVVAALDGYRRVPDDVWIGSNSIGDKVQWLANRCEMNDATIKKLHADKCISAEVLLWLQAGKYRQVMHRHDGTFRLVDSALNISFSVDSLNRIDTDLKEQWEAFKRCDTRAP